MGDQLIGFVQSAVLDRRPEQGRRRLVVPALGGLDRGVEVADGVGGRGQGDWRHHQQCQREHRSAHMCCDCPHGRGSYCGPPGGLRRRLRSLAELHHPVGERPRRARRCMAPKRKIRAPWGRVGRREPVENLLRGPVDERPSAAVRVSLGPQEIRAYLLDGARNQQDRPDLLGRSGAKFLGQPVVDWVQYPVVDVDGEYLARGHRAGEGQRLVGIHYVRADFAGEVVAVVTARGNGQQRDERDERAECRHATPGVEAGGHRSRQIRSPRSCRG